MSSGGGVMATGYWIVKGDKTSCGGTVLNGRPEKKLGKNNSFTAVNGSPVSCGKHPGTYSVGGGHPGDIIHGSYAASTLYSRSTCPCKAFFIPSQTFMSHGLYQAPQRAAAVAADISEPKQLAQAACKNAPSDTGDDEKTPKKKREITLTIGVFFDGTGNNANNCGDRQAACTADNFGMSDAESASALSQCILLNRGLSGTAAASYLGYYTNVYWLNTLYTTSFPADGDQGQSEIYIEGIGTESGEGDSTYGMGTGRGNTGVVRKTDKAVAALVVAIKAYLGKPSETNVGVIKELQFDIFGFSRGAAAARHFANRVFGQDSAIIAAIKTGLDGVEFAGTPGGKTRFLGIFDTVAAIGSPANGFNPHSADTGEVNIVLRPGVAEKVFHLTAQHECRFNFALNSVKPAWPELALPGAHSDIGGGYNPDEHEACFLTRPQFETVPLSTPDTATRIYQQTGEQLRVMETCPAIAPLLQSVAIHIDTWHDERIPADRYGMLQKRSGAAAVIDRPTRNDWSKVALRVMLDAAQDAGVVFDPILPKDDNLSLRPELNSLCEKAIVMGRGVRRGQPASGFTTPEIEMLAAQYLHCPANWNGVVRDGHGMIAGAVKPAKMVTFTNRPDERWQRTVYDMEGNKIWK
ncbi:PAAR domain-containing protein [Erwinia amylovora]|uniref:PAAR domain-containing protein n=1 Tax=Erwinia amylovora TaxID=552 RepID=UPI0014441A3B|nr:PAAR domain-containing protein [Erwinia amylovora]